MVRFVQNEEIPIGGIEEFSLTIRPTHQKTGHKHYRLGLPFVAVTPATSVEELVEESLKLMRPMG